MFGLDATYRKSECIHLSTTVVSLTNARRESRISLRFLNVRPLVRIPSLIPPVVAASSVSLCCARDMTPFWTCGIHEKKVSSRKVTGKGKKEIAETVEAL